MCKVSKYKFFLVCIFSYSHWIRRFTEYSISVFNRKGKKGYEVMFFWHVNVNIFKKFIQYNTLYIEIKRKRKKLLSRGSTYHCFIFNSWFLKTHSQVWDNFWQLKVLQIWWKIFLFHLKSSFHFKVI